MRTRAIVMTIGALTLMGAYALPASASPPSTKPPGSRPPATPAHSSTVTIQCNGSGSFTDNFVTDANAAFGQQTEVAAFNASPQPSDCQVVGP